MNPILIQTCLIGGTGLICGAILAIAARVLAVHEDPRVERVTALLPGMNCGGCGFAGCAGYAEAVVLHGKPVDLCQPGGTKVAVEVAQFMGVTHTIRERHVALVRCQGDSDHARTRSLYNGIANCTAMEQVGGNKACRYGCLGLGSCSRACPAGAIEIRRGLAIVHPDLCIGCGLCVTTCPRRLIMMAPESRYIHILCMSQDRGPDVKKVCTVGCIACTICFKTVAGAGIKMEGHLAVVDYSVPLENEAIIAKCPQHSIVNRTGRRESAT